ncbi:MAG: hypothetical protein ACP5KO_03130 [Caldimicrobium sp.]
MKKRLGWILLSFIFLFPLMLWAEEKVEVVTPEKTEVKSDIYYPVPNVPVLSDLNYQPEESALLKTGSYLTGILVFKGNYNASSLVEFYRVQMKSLGWQEIGSFTSKVNFLAFKRPEGQAFINIKEGFFQTELRIIVFLTGVK